MLEKSAVCLSTSSALPRRCLIRSASAIQTRPSCLGRTPLQNAILATQTAIKHPITFFSFAKSKETADAVYKGDEPFTRFS